MAIVLFTMHDVEKALFEEQRRGPGLGQIAAGAAGLAAAGAGTYLAIKNRKAIGKAAGDAIKQVGGYWRKTKKGAKTFVKDQRVGAGGGGRNTFNPNTGARVSSGGNTGGFKGDEVAGNVRSLSQTSSSVDPRIAAQRSSRQKSTNATGMGFSRRVRTIYFSRRAY